MVAEAEIIQVATRIAAAVNAERVILFGSHARGDARADSDVDLLVVADSDLPRFKRSRQLYGLFRPYPFAMDLLVYTPAEVERGLRSPVSFIASVFREGRTLYERRS